MLVNISSGLHRRPPKLPESPQETPQNSPFPLAATLLRAVRRSHPHQCHHSPARHFLPSPPLQRRRVNPDGRLSPPRRRRRRLAPELHPARPRGCRRLTPPRVCPIPTPYALLVLDQSPPRDFTPGDLGQSPFRGEGGTPGPPRCRRPSGGANRESTLYLGSLRLLQFPAARFSYSQACFFVSRQLIRRSFSFPFSLCCHNHFGKMRVGYMSYGDDFDCLVPHNVLFTLLW